MDFKELLDIVRSKHCWTQEQLAEAVGVSQTTISNYEIGRTPPKSWVIKKLKQLADIDESEEFKESPSTSIEAESITELKMRLKEAETEARIYKHIFDRLIDRITININGDIRGIKEGLGAGIKHVASGHT